MEALRIVLVVLTAMVLRSEPMGEATRWMGDLGSATPADASARMTAVSTPSHEQARDENPGGILAAQRTASRSRVRYMPAQPVQQEGLRRICASRGERSPPAEPCSVPPGQDHLRENGCADARGECG